jgi:hypothetical protein
MEDALELKCWYKSNNNNAKQRQIRVNPKKCSNLLKTTNRSTKSSLKQQIKRHNMIDYLKIKWENCLNIESKNKVPILNIDNTI